MKALIFGGTRFMGKYVSREFLEAGYEVTIANRGTNEPVSGVKALKIDRSNPGAVEVLKGSKFDVVIDFSAYPSAWVKEAGEVLKGNIGRYLFISSGAVYKKSNYFPIQEHFERAPNELFFTYSDEKIKGDFVDPNHPSLQQQGFNLRDMLFPFPESTGYLDYRKLQNYTGFVPRFSLKEAISEFYQDMIARGNTSPRRYELEDRALALLNLKD